MLDVNKHSMSCGKPCLSIKVLCISTSFYFSLLEKKEGNKYKRKKKYLKNTREHTAMPGSLSWNVLFCFSQLTLFKWVFYVIKTRAPRDVLWILCLDLQSQWCEDFDISGAFFLLKIHCGNLSYTWKFALVTAGFLVTQLNSDHIWTENKKLFVFKTQQPPHPAMTSVLPHQMIRGVLN